MRGLIIRMAWHVFAHIPFPDNRVVRTMRRRIEFAHLARTDIFRYRAEILRAMGARVGENCRFMPMEVFSEPSLVEIGNNVIISGKVVLLTHDGGVHTLTHDIPNLNGHYGRISIGDNCFIGFGAIVMPNVSIGKNCIVAAGSVVFESCPDGCVLIGNPARVAFKTSLYLAMKKNSPYTIVDPDHPFPEPYPRELLDERIGALPIRPPRGIWKPKESGDSRQRTA